MNKLLICDICGTSYADTEESCPTCGYSRAFDEASLEIDRPRGPREKVRGGRYSEKNVRKRLMQLAKEAEEVKPEPVPDDAPAPVETEPEKIVIPEEPEIHQVPAENPVLPQPEEEVQEPAAADVTLSVPENPEESQDDLDDLEKLAETIRKDVENAEEGEVEDLFELEDFEEEVPAKISNRRNIGLNIVLIFASAVFLLSSAYLVVTYGVPYIQQMLNPGQSVVETPTMEATQPVVEQDTVPATEVQYADLVLNYESIIFIQAGHITQLDAAPIAAESITWTSDDPTVAEVSETGLITAVGPGTTTIRAVCGQQEAAVAITCAFQ